MWSHVSVVCFLFVLFLMLLLVLITVVSVGYVVISVLAFIFVAFSYGDLLYSSRLFGFGFCGLFLWFVCL